VVLLLGLAMLVGISVVFTLAVPGASAGQRGKKWLYFIVFATLGLGFILIEIAAILMSIVMLRENIFSKYTAWSGILGFIILLIIEVSSSFISGLTDQLMILAILGGILSMLWYVLIARRLFQLAKE